MTARKPQLAEMPHWPRLMDRETAAAYVGLSPNQFIIEVEAGSFPAAARVFKSTARAVWDKREIDAMIDRRSRIQEDGDAGYEARKAEWQRRQNRTAEAR